MPAIDIRWRACSIPSAPRHRLRRNRIRRLGRPDGPAHRRRVLDEALSTVFRTPVRDPGRGTHRHRRARHRPGGARRRPRRRARRSPTRAPVATRRTRVPAAGAQARRGCCPTTCACSTSSGRQDGFDARFSALRRHYVYRLSTAPYGVEPQQARFVTPWLRPLDSTRWLRHRENLLGLHDFAAFCRHRDGATTIRDLQRLDWSRDGDLVTAYVTADAFCWSMVRSLVGALLAVGEGRREPGLVRGTSHGGAAIERLRRRARPRPHLDRRRLSARRSTRGADQGDPRRAFAPTRSRTLTTERRRSRACPRRSRPPD